MSATSISTIRATLFALFGPLTWGVYFLVVYGGHASLCAAGDRLPLIDAGALPLLLVTATVGALVILAIGLLSPPTVLHLLRAKPAPNEELAFLTAIMRVLTALSLIGVLLAAMAIATVPLCAQFR
jgi:hypothetical protein